MLPVHSGSVRCDRIWLGVGHRGRISGAVENSVDVIDKEALQLSQSNTMWALASVASLMFTLIQLDLYKSYSLAESLSAAFQCDCSV